MPASKLKVAYRRRFPRGWPREAKGFAVPPCPPGWSTGPPDFVGVGVQRCGTTRWFHLIRSHPDVARAEGSRKELHYFDRFNRDAPTPEALAAYHDYFPRPSGKIVGEWTPRYIQDFWTPDLLRQTAPDAKLLTILRDPVDRYRSGITFHLKNNAPHHPIVVADAVGRGFYFNQLQRLLRTFPQEQVFVLQFERCNAETREELRRTYEFLGVDPAFVPDALGEVVHRTRVAKKSMDDTTVRQLVATYEPDVAALVERFPSIDLTLWPYFAHLR